MVMGDMAIRLRSVTPFNVNGENRSGIGDPSLFFEGASRKILPFQIACRHEQISWLERGLSGEIAVSGTPAIGPAIICLHPLRAFSIDAIGALE